MSTVIVGGALANKVGSGGEAWVRMSWVRGLQQLGLDVWFVEQLGERADEAETKAAADWFQNIVDRFDVSARATLLNGDDALVGTPLADLLAMAPDAVLVNISGHIDHASLFPAFRRRVLVDIDPGFTQFWHAAGNPGARVDGHDLFFTIGELIGTPECSIPTCGLQWRAVRQPVVLEDWPVTPVIDPARFTTVANWRGPYGVVEHDGRTFGLKVHEFRKVLELPRRCPHRFEIALSIHSADDADRRALLDNEWHLTDPATAAGDPDAFSAYVTGSGSEFSVAQGVYVDTRCGWFSDRTVRYLACGRPALVQETGFARTLSTGLGLVPFTNLAEAVAGADDIVARYDEHAETARTIAERYFSAGIVLDRFCDEAGIS
jgi:hypothetical protein